MPHPLDRPIWHALATRQAHLAIGDGRAVRFLPEVHLFAAAADATPASVAALAHLFPEGGMIGLVEAAAPEPLPGTSIRSQATLVQMTATALAKRPPAVAFEPLGDADAADMLALATLTAPGPFLAQTHRLGDFIGIRRDGRLVAMAGERLKPTGFTEVSAVCTHPDHRGKGYAQGLMRAVIERILARGETAFLHAYPDNPAVGLYEALGFRVRSEMIFTVFERG